MGRKKKSIKKVVVKEKPKLPRSFKCPLCYTDESVACDLCVAARASAATPWPPPPHRCSPIRLDRVSRRQRGSATPLGAGTLRR